MTSRQTETLIRLGISTCPNDTFAFHGLLTDKVDRRGLRFDIQLLDIQQLNERLLAGSLDVAKISYFAALQQSRSIVVLPSGSAIGFGVGPVLLSPDPTTFDDLQRKFSGGRPVVLCPGETTTATFLTRTMLPIDVEIQQVLFSEIMPLLVHRRADLGTCIHEGRFVWREEGLHLVADLGEKWEQATSSPLPLGGLVARSELPVDVLATTQRVIVDSIRYAQTHRDETIPTMRKYAQEYSDEVLMSHVDLYVNDWTVDLGSTGRQSLLTMHRLAVDRNLLRADQPPLRVFDG